MPFALQRVAAVVVLFIAVVAVGWFNAPFAAFFSAAASMPDPPPVVEDGDVGDTINIARLSTVRPNLERWQREQQRLFLEQQRNNHAEQAQRQQPPSRSMAKETAR